MHSPDRPPQVTGVGKSSPLAGSARYKILDKIGRGGFGFVYRAFDQQLGRIVAAKLIDLEEAGDEMEDVQQEIAVMSTSHCPQLTEYYTSFVSENQLWIIMEHLEAGSLSDVMKDFGPLSEASCAFVIRELLKALVYLHKSRKIHRDIKAGNILVSGSGLIKLSDFGVTGQLTDSMNKRKTRVGTPFWMAPEVITETQYDENADIWSVGITAIELAKGFPPHAKSMHPMQVIFLIPKQPPPVLDGDFSDTFKNFVATCLVKDPSGRPSSAALLNHAFLAGAALTEELRERASARVVRQEEALKAMEAQDQGRISSTGRDSAGYDRQLQRGPRSAKEFYVPSGISELRTLETGRTIDRPTQPNFEYDSNNLPPAPITGPIKRSSSSGPVRGLGRDPLAAALAAANAAAFSLSASGAGIRSVATGGTGAITPPFLSPRSDCDVNYSYSVNSHDGDSNNTSGWDFDLTIKTRNSQGSQYSYSYSGKNFPDIATASAVDGLSAGIADIVRTSSSGNALQSPRFSSVNHNTPITSISGNNVGIPSLGINSLRRSIPVDSAAGKRTQTQSYAADVDSAIPSNEENVDNDEAVIIDEATLRQYADLDPPMTDTEAFSTVLGVLSRFRWQFVDRTPHTSDIPRSTDLLQAKQMKRSYRQYIKQLDAIMARNPGGVEYSREKPIRPSALFKQVVVPAMGGVGSSAAVLLGTDLIGGSGLRGIDPMCFCWGKNRDEEREGELPVTPITLSSVIDIMSPGPSQDRAGGNNSIKKGGKALNSHNVDSKDADRTSTLPFVGLDGTSNAHNFWRTGSNELKPQISRSNSGTGESDVYQSADALLNHLYATAVPGLSSTSHCGESDPSAAVSIVELEQRRDRESRALLWALERCLLALDIQSGGGATSEVLSTLMGYMMEEMEDGDGEDGAEIKIFDEETI